MAIHRMNREVFSRLRHAGSLALLAGIAVVAVPLLAMAILQVVVALPHGLDRAFQAIALFHYVFPLTVLTLWIALWLAALRFYPSGPIPGWLRGIGWLVAGLSAASLAAMIRAGGVPSDLDHLKVFIVMAGWPCVLIAVPLRVLRTNRRPPGEPRCSPGA